MQWVSPYSADLQKKATDMIADVSAWEGHMRAAAGTAAADPRHPDVQDKLNTWHGTIEAMGDIERGIDPGSTACDAFIAKVSGSISEGLTKALPPGPVAGGLELKPIPHCESLPDIFTRMDRQVTGATAATPGIPFELAQQCQLPWLSDDYFVALRQARATAGAPAQPVTANAKPGMPTKAQQDQATERCRALFVPEEGKGHGDAVNSLIIELVAITYREGRQAAANTK